MRSFLFERRTLSTTLRIPGGIGRNAIYSSGRWKRAGCDLSAKFCRKIYHLFFHGNAEALGDLEPFLRAMHDHGFAVFAFDYPGYGRSTGGPSEQGIYAATTTASRYLRDTIQVPSASIVAYGRSLGGGPAVELAIREPLAGLVLHSAFTSVYRAMTHWPLLSFDKFENLRKLPRVSYPLFVMQGKLDRVVPFDHGLALYAAAAGRRMALWIDDAGHNNFRLPSLGIAEAIYGSSSVVLFQLCEEVFFNSTALTPRKRSGQILGAKRAGQQRAE